MVNYIPTDSLRSPDVPMREAEWPVIARFALTFNGYEWAGSLEGCAELANSTRRAYDHSPEHRLPELTLDQLRTCLFFEQRSAHHCDDDPKGECLEYVRALLDGIREGLTLGTG